MKKRDSDATIAFVCHVADELTDTADHAELLSHLVGGLIALKRPVDARRTCDEAERLMASQEPTDKRLAPIRVRLWEQRAMLGDKAGAQVGLRKLGDALAAAPRPKTDLHFLPGGDVLRARFPLAEERRFLGNTEFAPEPDDILAAVALAQARFPDPEGVWRTLKSVRSGYASREPLRELVRTLYRSGRSREGKETLERARPYFGTRDFDLANIARLQAEVGDIEGAKVTAATMRTDERVRYRLEIRVAIAEARLKRSDFSGAARDAREIAQAAEKLQKSQVGIVDLAWFRGQLREQAGSLLNRAGFTEEAKLLVKQPTPESDTAQPLPRSPRSKTESGRQNGKDEIRQLQMLALTCARSRAFEEAERVARTIPNKEECLEALRRIALIAADSLIA